MTAIKCVGWSQSVSDLPSPAVSKGFSAVGARDASGSSPMGQGVDLGHKLYTMTENLLAPSAHGPQFPVPSSKFTMFVTPDRFGITDASLSHFVFPC